MTRGKASPAAIPEAEQRARRVDRYDRMGLALFGVGLMVVSGYGLARGSGSFGAAAAAEPVLTVWARTTGAERRGPLLLLVAIAGIVVALAAARVLIAQFQTGRRAPWAPEPVEAVPVDDRLTEDREVFLPTPSSKASRGRASRGRGEGRNAGGGRAAPQAARRGLEQMIGRYPGVDRVSARLVAHPPSVVIKVRTHEGVDVPALCRQINKASLPGLRNALHCPELAARLEIDLGDRPGPNTPTA